MQDEIFWELEKSPYKYKLEKFEFVFSSKFYLNKFKNEYKNYLLNEVLKLKNRYRSNFNCNEMLLISFYRRVEKRGFRVFYEKNLLSNYEIDLKINRIN